MLQVPSSTEEICNDTAYLNSVNGDQNGNSWNCTIQVNGHAIPFKLDTGAEVTVVTEESAKSFKGSKDGEVQEDRKQLTVLGTLTTTLVRSSTANICSETITPKSVRITCY